MIGGRFTILLRDPDGGDEPRVALSTVETRSMTLEEQIRQMVDDGACLQHQNGMLFSSS
jgi:hypothetical protein